MWALYGSLFTLCHSFCLIWFIAILVWYSHLRMIGAYHLFVAFAPCDITLDQVIVVLNYFQCGGLAVESNFQILVSISVVSLLRLLAMLGADMFVPFGLALGMAVPQQQYPPTRTTVLVPSGRLDASFPNHTPLAIVPRSPPHSVS